MKRTVLLLALLAAPALAGPPGICIDVEIGAAKSLPWGKTGHAPVKGYTAKQAVGDTLKLLNDRTPLLVRMETIRRAALYISDDAAQRDRLLAALLGRIADAEANGRQPAWAWFDAGYARGCFEQYGLLDGYRGYRWVLHSRSMFKGTAGIDYACAILALMPDTPHFAAFEKHLAAAKKTKQPLLLKNVERFEKLAKGLIEHVRKN